MMFYIENFLDNLPPVRTARQMRDMDAAAVSFGIPENMLMENAARSAFAILRRLREDLPGKAVWLFMGGGNNGGDAICLARHLLDHGARPLVFHWQPAEAFRGAAAFHFKLAKKDGVRTYLVDSSQNLEEILLEEMAKLGEMPAVLVDGLLGTGFHGELREDMQANISAINRFCKLTNSFMFSLDIPSGLNADTGAPSPIAVKATATVTFASIKPGLALPGARPWTGDVYLAEIGMPQALNVPHTGKLLDARAFLHAGAFPENSFKNTYGHVLIIGGAPEYSGAPRLAALGALRSGAGLVTVCAPEQTAAAVKSGLPEIMTFSCGENWPESISEELLARITRATALVVGPGLGRSPEAAAFLAALLGLPNRPPTVFDADALFALADNLNLTRFVTANDIFTPHPGEAAFLTKSSGASIQADRPLALQKLCALAPAVMVLKGAGTFIGQSGETVLLCPYDIPQLAIAGSGDVLAGILGALLGAGMNKKRPALAIAGQGVLLHALAGLILARKFPQRGGGASNLAECLPEVGQLARNFPQAALNMGLIPWPC